MAAPLIPGGMNIGSIINVSSIMYWVLYIFLGIIMLGGIAAVFYYNSFPIKANIFQIYGSGKDGVFAFSKRKTNRVRWNKSKTAWEPLFPLMNRKKIQPFDTEYLYPGRQIYVFELNGEWMPGRINISKTDEEGNEIPEEQSKLIEEEIKAYLRKNKKIQWVPGNIKVNQTEENIRCEINPVPYTVREWQSIEYKRNAVEYAEHNFWNDNRSLVVFLICAAIIIGAAVATVWLTYKLAGAGRGDIQGLISALNNVGQIPGQGPQ